MTGFIEFRRGFFLLLLLLLLSVIHMTQVGSANADFAWNESLGRFMRVGEEPIKPTAEEQKQWIDQLVADGQTDEAVKACSAYLKYFSPSPMVPEILMTMGRLLESQEEFDHAFKAYQQLFEDYPNNSYVDEILARQFEMGVRFMEGARFRLMGVPTIPMPSKAVEIFDLIHQNAPFHDVGEKAFYFKGLALEKQAKFQEAMETYEDFLDEYPSSSRNAEVSFRIAHVVYQMSETSREKEQAIDLAKDKVGGYLEKYAESPSADQARKFKQNLLDAEVRNAYDLGRYYEKKRRLQSAVIYYQEAIDMAPDSSWGKLAAERVALLKNPEQALAEKEAGLENSLEQVRQQLGSLRAKEPGKLSPAENKEIHDLELQEDFLRKKRQSLNKGMVEEIRYQWEVLERKEAEKDQRQKALDKRREELLKNHGSDEVTQALQQEELELQEESFALNKEREKLQGMSDSIGYRRTTFLFLRKPSVEWVALEPLERYGMAELKRTEEKLNAEKANMDGLMKERESLLAQMTELESFLTDLTTQKEAHRQALLSEQEKVTEKEKQITTQEERLQELVLFYSMKKRTLKSGTKGPEEPALSARPALLEARKEQIQKRLLNLQEDIQEIGGLFEQGQALEQKRKRLEQTAVVPPVAGSERQQLVAERDYRKKIKQLEKDINEQYRLIDDMETLKRQKVRALDELLQSLKKNQRGWLKRTGDTISGPVRGLGRGLNYFIFGMKDKEAAVAEQVQGAMQNNYGAADQIDALRQEIQLSNERIEAARAALKQLYQDLKEQKKQGNEGGFKSILLFPENIFKHEPGRSPDKAFLEDLRLKKEEEVDRLNAELLQIEAAIQAQPANATGEAVPAAQTSEAIRNELDQLAKTIKTTKASLAREKKDLKAAKKKWRKHPADKQINEAYSDKSQGLDAMMSNVLGQHDQLGEALRTSIEKQMRLFNEQEKINQKRLARIEKLINKFKGSSSPKMKQLEGMRKEIFEQMDAAASSRRNLKSVLESIAS